MAPLVAARGATSLGATIVAVLVGRTVSPDKFGTFSGLLAVASIIVGGSSSGLPVLAMRRVSRGGASAEFIRSLGIAAVRIGSGAAIATILFDIRLFGLRDALTLGTLSVVVSIALTLLTSYSAVRSGKQEYLRSAAGELIGGLATVVLAVLTIRLGFGVAGALVSLAVGPLLGALILARNVGTSPEEGSVRQTGILLREVVPFIALGFAGTGYLRIDAPLLGAITTPSTLGQYAAAYRILGLFSLLGSGFASVFFSRISANPLAPGALLRATCFFAPLVSLPAMIVFILAPDIVRLIFGPSYEAATTPLRVLVFAIIPYGLYWPTAQYLNAAGLERQVALILGAGALVDVLLVVVLAPRLGATGAAIAWVTAECTTLLLSTTVLLRSTRKRRPTS